MEYQDLKARTKKFAATVGKWVNVIPYSISVREYAKQLVRSSSSVGANYRAAGRAKSTKDFLYKISIVQEESDECIYWLELISEVEPQTANEIRPLIAESKELTAIFTSIGRNVFNKLNNTPANSSSQNLAP